MHRTVWLICLCTAALCPAPALAADVTLPRDTRVYLSTLEELIGKKNQLEAGRLVRCAVWKDVLVGGQLVIAAGTPALARVDSLSYSKVAGIKGRITLAALETEALDHKTVQLTGGYLKEGTGRVALSASLAGLVAWPLIFIKGKAAELPVGTVFDAYTQLPMSVALAGDAASVPPAIDLGGTPGLSAELLYDKLQGQEKPRVFEFLIHAPADAPAAFVIDVINGEGTDPIALTTLSSGKSGDELTVNAAASIADLAQRFKRGINTVEIAYGEARSASARKS